MTSEITRVNPLRVKQWEACKKRILDKIEELANIQGKTIIEMLPDIRIIKENELWKLGGYRSFNEFCGKCLGVSRQYVYRILVVNQDARKVLEINDANPSWLTSVVFDTLALEAPKSTKTPEEKPPEKALNDPPKPEKKGRKKKPEPEPVDATFTETNSAENVEIEMRGISPALLNGTTPAPAVDKCSGGNGTIVPADVPALLTDDYCLELSALVTGNVEQRTGRAVTESEDAHLAIAIGEWLKYLRL